MGLRNMRILTIGLSPDTREKIVPHLRKVEEVNLSQAEDLKRWVSSAGGPAYDIVVAGSDIPDVAPTEIAQLIRMKAPTTPAMFLAGQADKSQVPILKKNGFDNVYILPKEEHQLRLKMHELEEEWTKAMRRDGWVPVGVCEIDPETELDFAIGLFLKLNNKMVVLANKGDKLDQSRVERLNHAGVHHVMVARQDLAAYTSYSARRLWELTQSAPYLDEEERREKLHRSVRAIVRGLFQPKEMNLAANEEQRRQATAIVSRFIVKANPPAWLFEFMKQPADLNMPSGRMNLASTLAGLFAIGLEMENVANVVAAALFQDVGLNESDLKTHHTNKEHVQLSVNILQARWASAPQEVCDAILQHHERWDGRGFPQGLKGDQISVAAQLIALGNHFTSVLTSNRDGAIDPGAVLKELEIEGAISPDLVKRVAKIIEEPGDNQ